MAVNVQSTISVILGQNTIQLITSQSLFTVLDTSQSLFGEVLGKTHVVEHITGKAEIRISRLENVMQGYIPTPSLKTRNLGWIPPGGWGVLNFYVRRTPLSGVLSTILCEETEVAVLSLNNTLISDKHTPAPREEYQYSSRPMSSFFLMESIGYT